jgi:hypothetical protein
MDEAASTKNIPMFICRISPPLFHGRHENVRIDAMITRNGASPYRNLSEFFRDIISFVRILITSAGTCRSPPRPPTRSGPIRHWKAAHTFRSIYIRIMASTAYITMMNTPTAIPSIVKAIHSGIRLHIVL